MQSIQAASFGRTVTKLNSHFVAKGSKTKIKSLVAASQNKTNFRSARTSTVIEGLRKCSAAAPDPSTKFSDAKAGHQELSSKEETFKDLISETFGTKYGSSAEFMGEQL